MRLTNQKPVLTILQQDSLLNIITSIIKAAMINDIKHKINCIIVAIVSLHGLTFKF